jgi:hypothetical protein
MEAFESLPGRIFLDSSTLQTLQRYGEFIFENIEPAPGDRTWGMRGHFDEIDALRAIFQVNQRATFEFALSAHSFQEVVARRDPTYLRWAYDVLDHWQACLAESGFEGTGLARAVLLDHPSFGYLGAGDRQLLRDALELECNAFLTMERRLPQNADHLQRQLGIRVLRPTGLWSLLRPYAYLWW